MLYINRWMRSLLPSASSTRKCPPLKSSNLLSVSWNPGHPLPDNERVDVVCALIGLNRLQIAHVAHDRVFVRYPVRTQQVPADSGAFQRDSDVVALQHGNVRGIRPAGILQLGHMVRQQLRLADLRDHPGQFLLHQLMGGYRFVIELLPCKRVAASRFKAIHRRSQNAPTDTESRLREAGESGFQPLASG